MIYAIKNRRTNRYISGTNFNRLNGIPVQMYADEISPPRLFTDFDLDLEIKRRHINLKTFKVVCIKIEEIKK